jgi:hypothetical protein
MGVTNCQRRSIRKQISWRTHLRGQGWSHQK